jgi:DNA-binding HxlR family transcriptional regulator
MLQDQVVESVVEEILNEGLIANIERKQMKNTDKIFDFINSATDPVTMKQLQDGLDMKPGILSGSLASLCKSGRLTREKVERTNGNGPKMQWAYTVVAQDKEKHLESSVG